jgi:hypothetical protein
LSYRGRSVPALRFRKPDAAFDCHPEAGAFCPLKDLGEPREASQPALSEVEGFFATQ